MPTRRAIGIVAVLVAFAAPLVALSRMGWFGPGDRNRQTVATRMAAQPVYADAAVTDLTTFPSQADLRTHLEATPREGDAALTPELWNALLSEVAGFLHVRYAVDDPTAYTAWRTERAYLPRPRDEMLGIGGVAVGYAILEDGSPPEGPVDPARVAGLSDAELFARFWNNSLTQFDGSGHVTALAATPEWMVCIAERTYATKGQGRAFAQGRVGDALWYGSSATSPRQWWRPARSGGDLADAQGNTLFVDVGILAAFADSTRKPLMLTLAWDQVQSRWWLLHMTVQNAPGPLPTMDY